MYGKHNDKTSSVSPHLSQKSSKILRIEDEGRTNWFFSYIQVLGVLLFEQNVIS